MKALILEDSIPTARLLYRVLSEHGEVEHALTPSTAFDIYLDSIKSGEPFTMLCLDLELPEFNGLEFLDEIRKNELERKVEKEDALKVFVITGHQEPETIGNATRLGCDSFLTKPVDIKKLKTEMVRLGV